MNCPKCQNTMDSKNYVKLGSEYEEFFKRCDNCHKFFRMAKSENGYFSPELEPCLDA